MRPGHPEVAKLLRSLKAGYRLASDGKAKFTLLDPYGKTVRRADGRPLSLPNSPSDERVIKQMRLELRKAGLIR